MLALNNKKKANVESPYLKTFHNFPKHCWIFHTCKSTNLLKSVPKVYKSNGKNEDANFAALPYRYLWSHEEDTATIDRGARIPRSTGGTQRTTTGAVRGKRFGLIEMFFKQYLCHLNYFFLIKNWDLFSFLIFNWKTRVKLEFFLYLKIILYTTWFFCFHAFTSDIDATHIHRFALFKSHANSQIDWSEMENWSLN